MSVAGSMLHMSGDGSILCAWLLGANMLLAVLMIALIVRHPDMMDSTDAIGM